MPRALQLRTGLAQGGDAMKSDSAPHGTLRLLHVEDCLEDGELVRAVLATEWADVHLKRVETRAEFIAALAAGDFDLILSDFSLPVFNGLAALQLAKISCPDTPFIFLSGTIGEENAVEALKQGATDYVIKDRMGRLVPAIHRALGTVREQQRRQLAEQQLRESQERFHQFAEQSTEIFWFVALNPEKVLYIGPAIESVWGRPAASFYLNPRAWIEAIHGTDQARVNHAYEECLAGRSPRFEEEFRVIRPDGSVRWVLNSATVTRDQEGRPVRLSGIAKDITARRADEDRLREQADLLDKAGEAIVVTGMDGRVVFWNHGAVRMLGWSAVEAPGRPCVELFGVEAAAKLNLQPGVHARDEWHGEVTLPVRQGVARVLKASVTIIRDDEGRPKSRLIIGSDITEQKELERQFLRAQRLESLGMLAAGIAHDLNNVLAPVLMGAPLLRPRTTHPADLRVLEAIEKSAVRGAALVRQILSFAHGAGGDRTVIQVKHLLREIAELVHETFPKSIQLLDDRAADLWTVEGNPTQIHQILLNLCVNARDAMPGGGTLRLGAYNQMLDKAATEAGPDAAPGPYLVLLVGDTGTGISPEVLAHIWEPFFTTKGSEKGTGLGLSTVRGIVANRGGFVTVETQVGRGTTFRVHLPATPAAEAPGPAVGSDHPLPFRGKGELILVVEDEVGVKDLVKVLLTRHGYRVLVAGNGLEAIALFTARAGEFSLIVTDVNMPELDGISLAMSIRRLNPAIRILFMSGGGGRFLPTNKTLPPGRVLSKPFTSEELLIQVRLTLDSPVQS